MTPSSGLINLLTWLTELRESLTYIYQVIKGHDQGHRLDSQMRRHLGQVWGCPEPWSICLMQLGASPC